MANTQTDDPRVRLIDVADQVARASIPSYSTRGLSGNEDLYLERFRAAYWHLARTVETSPMERSDTKVPTAAK